MINSILFNRLLLWLIFVLIIFSCEKEEEDVNAGLTDNLQFTYLPTDLDAMWQFGPIGALQGLPKAHGGFRLKAFRETADIPVYAMADGIIYNIIKDQRTAESGYAPAEYDGFTYDDHRLEIAVSRTSNIWYGHVTRLADDILAAVPDLKAGRDVENRVRIEIAAGQVIGFLGPHQGFDIGMYDFKKENFFINPDRYSEFYRHTQPWTDYLTTSLKNQVWAINPRISEPRGGTIAYDVAGTIAGNWFLEGTTSILEWSKQLVIARHEIYADRITILDGSPLLDGDGLSNAGRTANTWFVIGNAPLSEEVKISTGMVKYEVITFWRLLDNPAASPEGTVAIQLIDDQTLYYQWFEGKSADQVFDFTAAKKIYKR